MKIKIFKGILYKNSYFYNLLDFLKLREKKNLRFKIAKKLIKKKSSLIDVCGGCGWLKNHLDKNINYTVADASKEFGDVCKKKNINFIKLNCKSFNIIKNKFDYTVMIISLYQFRKNLKKTIKNLKKISKRKIIIIEEILPFKETDSFRNIKKKIRDYLCNTNFYEKNNDLFSSSEFEILMKKNNFKLIKKFINNNILVGILEIKSK
jgi:ubiquinone/menaquinone biosynthesis C-methylase UbiE